MAEHFAPKVGRSDWKCNFEWKIAPGTELFSSPRSEWSLVALTGPAPRELN